MSDPGRLGAVGGGGPSGTASAMSVPARSVVPAVVLEHLGHMAARDTGDPVRPAPSGGVPMAPVLQAN